MPNGPSYTIKKIEKRSTESQAADMLREAIVSGDIPLGTRLTELGAAAQLGVSRGTIRTAFHQLVQEGLVIQVPYTGWTVMRLNARDAWELYTLRSSLEALAAELVAERAAGDQAVRAAVQDAFDQLADACAQGSRDVIASADMALHSRIVALSGHRRLGEQYALIQHQIRIYIGSSDALVAEPSQIVAQHQPLLDALLSGDSRRAGLAARDHNKTEGAILVEHLQRCVGEE